MQYAIFVAVVNHRSPSTARLPLAPVPVPEGCSVGIVVERIVYGLSAPRAPLGVPVRKPFLNLRETSDRERMRPVPVVFLRLAFSDQLSVEPVC